MPGLWVLVALGILLTSFLVPYLGGVVLVAGTVIGVRAMGGSAEDIGWRRPPRPARSALLGVTAGVVAWLVFTGIGMILQALFPDIDTLAPYRDALEDPFLTTLLVVGAVVIAPIGEEMFWRGYLLTMLASSSHRSATEGVTNPSVPRWPTHWVAIVVTAVIFAAVHLNPPAFLQLLLFGLLLAWLRRQDGGSLVMPVVAHATNNTITIVALVVLPTVTG
ncbi:MAG: CPBP family intramembrane metalloprotease [Acidimicrobiia bacterium]|nr:CPBP family intramembrane metalloprotease [Acidimicrobiia bacterium]